MSFPIFFNYWGSSYLSLISKRIWLAHGGLKSRNSMLRELHIFVVTDVSAIGKVRYQVQERLGDPFFLVRILVIS